MIPWGVLASWVALLLAGVFAGFRGVFSGRITEQWEIVRTAVTLGIAFLGWVGISSAVNGKLRGNLLAICSNPTASRALTVVTFLLAGGLTFVASRMTRVSFDCSGSVDQQVFIDNELEPLACQKPVYLAPDAQITWKSALGPHPPVTIERLPRCKDGRARLCTSPYRTELTAVHDTGNKSCARWRVAVDAPIGGPAVAYLKVWSEVPGAKLSLASKCANTNDAPPLMALDRGDARCWHRNKPNFLAQVDVCFPPGTAQQEPRILTAAAATDLEDPCKCD